VSSVSRNVTAAPGASIGRARPGPHEKGPDRVELADVPEGERPQERPRRRGRPHPDEQSARRAVAQQVHVLDGIRAGVHARHQRRHLQRTRVTGPAGDDQILPGQLAKTGQRAQYQDRDMRFGSSNRAARTGAT
jgi:hypothetical protein